MTAKTQTENMNPEKIEDNLSNETIATPSQEAMDMNKLAALKAKNQSKQMETKPTKKERSINFGFIGSGQAGTNLAGAAAQLGYEAVAINTAQQDLKLVSNISDSNKLLLEYTLGGAAKDLEIGKAAAEANKNEIVSFIDDRLENSQINVLCLSLGGGSGAGSCETLVDVLSETGKPLIVITVLPMDTEDAQTKQNALETLSKLAKLTQSKKVHNLICVDNAKLESIYQHVGQMDFYTIANKAIIEPLDIFNTLSAAPSTLKALDSMEWLKLLTDGEGLSVYGELTVDNYKDDTAIAEAVVNSLDSNLLSGGFDLKQAKYVGVIIAANKEVWQAIPSSSVNYAMAMIGDISSPKATFKGIYTVDIPDNVVKIYSMFSGLSLPESRVEQLKKEVKELTKNTKAKDEARNLSLKIDTGTEEAVSQAQKIKEKIANKGSAYGKFLSNMTDRRNK